MEPEQKSNGALTGLVVIIIILIIGGIYLWKNNTDSIQEAENPAIPNSANSVDAELDSELDSIDIEGLDSGI